MTHDQIDQAMVLGAGLGTRLKPFTEKIPKPLIPVHGIPCMEYALTTLANSGIKRAIINVHAHAPQMRDYFRAWKDPRLLLQESNEENALLGSAGGFRQALNHFHGSPFIAMNADVIHLTDLNRLRQRHAELRKSHLVMMTLVLNTGKLAASQSESYRAIKIDASSGLVTGFGEKKRGVDFYSGTAIFEPDAFSHLPQGEAREFVPEVLEPAIKARRVGFLLAEDPWMDVGSPELWRDACVQMNDRLNQGQLPSYFQDRLKSADPTVGGRFELGKSSIRYEDIEYAFKDLRSS